MYMKSKQLNFETFKIRLSYKNIVRWILKEAFSKIKFKQNRFKIMYQYFKKRPLAVSSDKKLVKTFTNFQNSILEILYNSKTKLSAR